jgi:hypothetical protein
LFWLAVGVVLTVITMLLVVGAGQVNAAPGDEDTTFVPITPCRLFDTRLPGDVPFGPNVTRTFGVHGTNGACVIPTEAVGLSMNVTTTSPTLLTFLTIWADGEPIPLASNLNPAPGEPPTPNAVTTGLSPTGRFNVFNLQGTVDVIVDINGYYVTSSLSEIHQRLLAVEAANLGLEALETRIAVLEALLAGVTRDSFGDLIFPYAVVASDNVVSGDHVIARNVIASGDVRADGNVVADADHNDYGGVYSYGDVCAGNGAVCLLP